MEHNNFLRSQFKAIGNCAHGRGFKFQGKRPAAILDHVIGTTQCPLRQTHSELCAFILWCHDLQKKPSIFNILVFTH
ncbi:hypothetical protein BT69DRAFT_315110 [Atractiella rhizophila]|nr:hypothetical protein BT69DRAFT_315110 [Atractiella rhizophila]